MNANKIVENIEKNKILIAPFNMKYITLDDTYVLHLDNVIGVYKETNLDFKVDANIVEGVIKPLGSVLKPGVIYHCQSVEEVSTQDYKIYLVNNQQASELGINVLQTQPYFNSDKKLKLTITVTQPVRVYPGMPIIEIYFKPKD